MRNLFIREREREASVDKLASKSVLHSISQLPIGLQWEIQSVPQSEQLHFSYDDKYSSRIPVLDEPMLQGNFDQVELISYVPPQPFYTHQLKIMLNPVKRDRKSTRLNSSH